MDNRTVGKNQIKDAERLMMYLMELPEEEREDIALAAYYFAQGVVAGGVKRGEQKVG